MLVSPHLALVGDRQFGLSSAYDCHVWAIRSPEGIILIDAGSGLAEASILGRLEWVFPNVPVKAILITHAHADHFAGAAGLSRRLGCPVIAPALTRAVVETGDEETCGLRRAREVGGYPRNLHLQPCPVASPYGHGDKLNLAGQAFEVIGVAGHSDDSSCLLTEIDGRRTLFSADVVHYGGILGLINSRDSTMQGFYRDLPRLSGLKVEALLSGHGLFTLKDGQQHVDAAIRLSRGGFVPRLIAQGDEIF